MTSARMPRQRLSAASAHPVSTSVPRQLAQSAHNKRVSPTTRPSSLHAQTNPTRDPRVHPTRDPRPACTLLSGPHIYGPAHTQPSFTSPEARDQPASPNLTVQHSKPRPAPPILASPHACDQIQRQTNDAVQLTFNLQPGPNDPFSRFVPSFRPGRKTQFRPPNSIVPVPISLSRQGLEIHCFKIFNFDS